MRSRRRPQGDGSSTSQDHFSLLASCLLSIVLRPSHCLAQINKEDLIFTHRKRCLPLSPHPCQFTNLQQDNIFRWEAPIQLDMLQAMHGACLRSA
ncbi:hypothetical protein AERO8C_150284 [Aeromonas veronii]|uniref:Uncharacterized protein n=1 Tax=Aeromonas veronii TaxID=654 RepID=A0A653KX55_AERVE|nr:hypothetical protein AERO8C_150284 [Aeromonas veronii]